MKITPNEAGEYFSIVIPSWNNLGFLKVCVESIQKNSTFKHQIVIHVNGGGVDGTLDWVKEQGFDYTFSEDNIGVCWAMNLMRTKVKTDYILFVNDDMYVLPEWDRFLKEEIEKCDDNKFYISSTAIQPYKKDGYGIQANYGDTIETFEEDRLLAEYKNYKFDDWMGSTVPPCILHKDMWDFVGGYSVEFSPGISSDPDISAKLWMAGVRKFKGLSDSRVYHFETKSTGRIKKNLGRVQFLLKFGITQKEFRKSFLHQSETYDESKVGTVDVKSPKKLRFYSRYKAISYLLLRGFGLAKKFI